MNLTALLAEASEAGLTLTLNGDRLVIHGPRTAESTALALLARKPEVVAFIRPREFRPIIPGACDFGVAGCGEPARLYPAGWRCGAHAPGSVSA